MDITFDQAVQVESLAKATVLGQQHFTLHYFLPTEVYKWLTKETNPK